VSLKFSNAESPLIFTESLFFREEIAMDGFGWSDQTLSKEDRPDLEVGVRENGHGLFSVLDPDLTKLGTHLSLTWLTVTNTKVTFRGVSFVCKIHVTARATFSAIDCAFKTLDERVECALEVFAGSSGNFSHCYFYQNNKAAIVFRDHAIGDMEDCNFTETKNTSVLVLDSSVATIKNCQFGNADKFSVYLYRDSKGMVLRSLFSRQTGKGLFMLKGSQCAIDCCCFSECNAGAVSVADGCKVYVRRSIFTDVQSSCVHGLKNCLVEVEQCILEHCRGNGVNFEFSTGFVRSCSFRDFTFPPLAVFGPSANPVFMDCRVNECHTIAVVARDA
jgi:hypothetical protein